MARLFYLHWHEREAKERVRPLVAAGHKVSTHWSVEKTAEFGAMLTDVVIISQDRLPSHGRAVAAVFWEAQNRRAIPIIFAGGEPAKVAATKAKFPFAVYCRADELVETVNAVLRNPPAPLPPKVKRAPPHTPGYSGKPLAVKLGVAEDQRIYLAHAPKEMDEWLGQLPANAKRISKAAAPINLAVLFHTSAKELKMEFASVAKLMAPKGMLWVSWPKKASKVDTDITEDIVRKTGLPLDWVDVKVCAVSEVWSGLKFLRRRKDAKRG